MNDYSDLYPTHVDTKDGKMAQFELTEEAMEKELRKSVQVALFVISGPWKGTYFKVWKSNMQKCVRRQDVKGALVSMVAVGESGGQYLSNMINRLCKVFISEDVGVANFSLMFECRSILMLYSHNKKEFMTLYRDNLLELVVKMAKSPKSRMVDTMVNHVNRNMSDEMEELNGEVNLIKCRRGFLEELKLNNLERMVMYCMALDRIGGQGSVKNGKSPRSYRAQGLLRKKMRIYWVWIVLLEEIEEMIEKFVDLRNECFDKGREMTEEEEKTKEVFDISEMVCCLCDIFCDHSGGGAILNIVHAVFIVSFFKDKFFRLVDRTACYRNGLLKEEEKVKWDDVLKKGIDCEIWPLSDSYDRHVGLRISDERKSLKFFFERGAKLEGVPDWLIGIEGHFNNLLMGSLEE
jgi:hypothetical protein